MRRQFFHWILIAGVSWLISCNAGSDLKKSYPGKVTVTAENPTELQRFDAYVKVDLLKVAEKCQKLILDKSTFIVMIKGVEIPSQQMGDKLCFTTNFSPWEKKAVTIRFSSELLEPRIYQQRAHAELSRKVGGYFKDHTYIGGEFERVEFEKVPPEHRDHSGYYRFEGPGWESDKVGYRFYLDQRNRIDIFGKKVREMVLPGVGLNGFDSYHEMADWGADIFKVGESLGIGSIATLFNGTVQQVYQTDSIQFKILSDGPVIAEMQTNYYGWKVGDKEIDLQSNLSIHTGTRLTKHKLLVSGGLENLVTGLVKTEGCTYIKGQTDAESKWNYVAIWGKQSLMGDNLGTALFYKNEDLISISEDELNHLVILKPENGKLKYYFAAAWEGETEGIKKQSEFTDYLNLTVQELNHPIEVIY
jgi:hypothetical protein